MQHKIADEITAPGSPWITSIPRIIIVSALYFVAAKLARFLAVPTGGASAFWPPSAIALCAILGWGKRMVPGVWLGAILASAIATSSIAAASIIGVGNMLEALAASVLLQRVLHQQPYFLRGENIVKFVAIAAISALVSASVGVLGLLVAGQIRHSAILYNWTTWAIGDTTGMIIFAPLILTMGRTIFYQMPSARLVEIIVFGTLLALATYIIFHDHPADWVGPYLLLTFIFFSAFRYNLAGVARTVVVIAVLSTWLTARGSGPFATDMATNESLMSLQIFLCIIWAVGMLLVALLEQRTRAETALREERDGLEERVNERTAALERHVREILRLEKAVVKREHQLAEAQRLAHLGSWEWDVAADAVTWTDEMYRIFEINKVQFTGTLESYAQMIHAEDRAMAQKIISDAMRTHIPYQLLHRIVTPKGNIKTLLGRGFTSVDRNGVVTRMFGTAQDVSELTALEHLWRAAEERYREVVEVSPHAIFILDAMNRCAFVNSCAVALCGAKDEKEVLNQSLIEFLHPEFRHSFLDTTRHLHDTKESFRLEGKLVQLDGKSIDIELTATNFAYDTDPFALVIMQDITERKRAERKFKGLLESAPDAMVIVNHAGDIVLVNSQAEKLFGYAREEIIGKDIEMLMPARFKEQHIRHRTDYFKHPQKRSMGAGQDLFGQHKDGSEFPVEISLSPLETEEGILISSIVRDMTVQRAIDQSLRLAAQVFECSREAIVILDEHKKIVQLNHAFTQITGFTADQIVDDKGDIIRSGLHDDTFYERIWTEVAKSDHWEGEALCRRRDSQPYMAQITLSALRDNHQQITNYIVIFSDISERKEAESRMRFMAEHDFLTRLPSRAVLLDRLGHAISSAKRNGTQLALLFIDLDRFKNINDTMGHAVGDKLLQHVADQLKKCVRRVDTICRQGGDEFIVLLTEVRGAEQVAHIADSIMRAIALPYKINGYEITITSSIGISMCPNDSEDIDALIKDADIAMYHSKESGRNRVQFFNDRMNERITARLALEESIRAALDKNEFVLQYQPQTDVVTGQTVGAEALIRWQHAEFGLLTPISFISVAEESGLIIPIGNWVLRTACHQAKTWLDSGYPLVVSVNISVAQFRDRNLVENVADALRSADLPPQYLELEVTESILAEDASNAVPTLMALRETGVKLAIDDFGTGYSSLSGLNRFTVDKLKIDQSFVRDITIDDEDAALTSAIISMAKNLKLKVVAEGVETQSQLLFLASHGCDEAQGFYVSKALSPDEFSAFRVTH
jgi:diguanylate cyclase (GGDEF)-like protein/PAS domain S-box-containing protein